MSQETEFQMAKQRIPSLSENNFYLHINNNMWYWALLEYNLYVLSFIDAKKT